MHRRRRDMTAHASGLGACIRNVVPNGRLPYFHIRPAYRAPAPVRCAKNSMASLINALASESLVNVPISRSV
eukprot:5456677-Amphidinium_carterae.1